MIGDWDPGFVGRGKAVRPGSTVRVHYSHHSGMTYMADNGDNKIHIIGIGDDGIEGLSSGARTLLSEAELVVGTPPTLALAATPDAEQVVLKGDLDEAVERLSRAQDQRVVVLALGDPLFFGTARFLFDRLGKDRFKVVPHVSTMQLAFARVKESWDEAYLTNLATTPHGKMLDRIRTAQKVGLFTTEEWPPAKVAGELLDKGIDYFSAYVCEDLGSPHERVTQGELSEVVSMAFSPLNVMILIRKPDLPESAVLPQGRRVFGNPDSLFLQAQPTRDLVTPAEIRAIALAEMAITPKAVVWDVGAGSGSVGIEAARMAWQGEVYAIESNAEDYELITENAKRFGVFHLKPIHGIAPEAWNDLPDPTSIFVDGTGRSVVQITRCAFQRLVTGGRIVVNVGSPERLAGVQAALSEVAGDVDVILVNVSKGTSQLDTYRLQAMNPSFLVAATRSE